MTESTPSEQEIAALRAQVNADTRSEAFVDLAKALNAQGKHEEAAQIANQGLLSHPDLVEGRIVLAIAESRRGRVKEALEQIQRALLIDQNNAVALGLMGEILLDRGLAKRAAQFLAHAVKLESGNEGFRELLARARQAMADVSKDETGGPRVVANKVNPLGLSSIPSEDSPWPLEEAQTVFAAKAADSASNGPADVPVAHLAAIPEVSKQVVGGAQQGLASLVSGDEIAVDHADDEPTKFTSAVPKRRGKLGGSAAELSLMISTGNDRSKSSVPPPQAPSKLAAEGSGPAKPKAKPNGVSAGPKTPSGEAGVGKPPSPAKGRPAVAKAPAVPSKSKAAKVPPPPPKPEVSDTSASPSKAGEAKTSAGKAGAAKTSAGKAGAAKTPAGKAGAAKTPAGKAGAAKTPAGKAGAAKTPLDPSKSGGAKELPSPGKAAAAKPPAASAKPGIAEVPPVSKAPPPTPSKPPAPTGDEAKSTPKNSSAKPSAAPGPKMNAVAQENKRSQDEPASVNGFGPVATRMIDDALFAILGTPREELDKQPAPAAPAEAAPLAGGAHILKPRVVRTSAKLGFWARVAGGVVLCSSAFGLGYAVALAPGAASPEVVREEIKGVAAELERGGLAALRTAEERVQVLIESNPSISPLMNGVLAETLARRYARFGRSEELRTKAIDALEATGDGYVSLEKTVAQVLLSTSTQDLAQLDKQLELSLKSYADSPKAWVARAEIAHRSGDADAAISHLTQARSIHPQHRQTLLETARWLAREGAFASSLETYALLQSNSDLDVEVAIERYLLGWSTDADSAHSEAVTLLAGLVRETIPEVAPDEVGRAAFAFALGHLWEGRIEEANASLRQASRAYQQSAAYQQMIGRVFLALGEVKGAEACFTRATDVEPDSAELWMDKARARFARALKLRPSPTALERQLARVRANKSKERLMLPLGEVRVRPTEFELVEVTLDPAVFREEDYLPLKEATAQEVSFEQAMKSLVASAVAQKAVDSGDLSKARRVVKRMADRDNQMSSIAIAKGQLLLAEGNSDQAVQLLESAVDGESSSISTLVALARAQVAAGNLRGAFDAYERFFDAGGKSTVARLEYARLQNDKGDLEDALETLDLLDTEQPDNVASMVLRAELHLEQDKYIKAQATIQKAIEVDARLVTGRAPEGIDELSPEFIMQMGRIVLKDDRKKGMRLLRNAVERPGAPPSVHFFLGKALMAKRKTRRAGRRSLQKYLALEPRGSHAVEAKRLRRRR
ncbi:MAG: tetratricopeptide repeat protein [Myxococcales bacterium]|nr:tetratricopeptide repeat protein [Myxococcales bacterium]